MAGDGSIARSPGQGAYARPEIERRFLLRDDPAGSASTREIQDLYLDDLRLRLRRVASGDTVAFKLTQKVRVSASDPHQVMLTNIYLDQAEYEVLRRLPGAPLRKSRMQVDHDTVRWSVDRFHDRLEGLATVEVELPTASAEVELPRWIGVEVTHDDSYSGGRLARASDAEIAALVHR